MVSVQGGTYTMGSQSSDLPRSDDECEHQVSVASFKMGMYKVTQADWYEITGTRPSKFKNCDDCPVEQVSWDDVQDFLKKLETKTGQKFRLPTEAEWEYAARGGSASKHFVYAGGNTLDDVAWHYGNGGSKKHSVGTKKANELGLYDMNGSVWEWCQDTYKIYPCDRRSIAGGLGVGFRVLRGGFWEIYGPRCANRSSEAPSIRSVKVGFRLAHD